MRRLWCGDRALNWRRLLHQWIGKGRRLLFGQEEGEARPFAHFAFSAYGPAVRLNKTFHNRQP